MLRPGESRDLDRPYRKDDRARADVVRDRLVRAGVDGRRIEVKAYGVDRALASNQSEEDGRTTAAPR